MSRAPKSKPTYGGRALPNGVLMTGPTLVAVAIRRDDGSIGVESAPFVPPFASARNTPFLRGIVSLSGALVLMVRSTKLEHRLGGKGAGRTQQILRMVLPALSVTVIERVLRYAFLGRQHPDAMRKGPGVFAMLMPMVALRISGLFPPGRTLLQYHAAEHMAVNTAEAGLPMSAESAAGQSRIHPRCGTSFALWAMLVGSRLNRGKKRGALGAILTGTMAVSIAYELIRLGAAHRDETWAKVVFGPSWQAQRLTTLPPNREHLEVATAALAAVLVDDMPAAEESLGPSMV